jgi:hypothetical protein
MKTSHIRYRSSQEILVALKQRFSERRNKDIVSLMKYLQGPNISRDESYEDFSYSTKPAAILLAKNLMKRLFSPPMNNDSPVTIPDFMESTPHQLRHHLRWNCKAALNLCHLYVQQLTLLPLLSLKKNLNLLMQLVLGVRSFSKFSTRSTFFNFSRS